MAHVKGEIKISRVTGGYTIHVWEGLGWCTPRFATTRVNAERTAVTLRRGLEARIARLAERANGHEAKR
jgi:hypothetical protein